MKKWFAIGGGALALAVSLLLPTTALVSTTGCTTTPVNTNGPSQVALDVAIGIEATVPFAVLYEVGQQPTTVTYFTAAANAIEGVSMGTNYSAAALMDALNKIPNSDNPDWKLAKAAVVAGVSLYRGLAAGGVFTSVDANYDLQALAAATREGLPPGTLATVRAKTATARAQYGKKLQKK